MYCNLSTTVLTDTHKQVLSLGFSFTPSHDFDLFSTLKDINKFVRGLTVKKHFWSNETTDGNELHETNSVTNRDFSDQMMLKTLKELENTSYIIENNITQAMDFVTSNPLFYPIESCSPAMDRFQFHVEQDLRQLKNSIIQQNKMPN